jgi:hypothetical protein
MKTIFGKLLMGIAVIALILGILAWIAGITAFFFRLFIWYKAGEWHRLAIIEFIPDSWIVKAITTWPGLQKILFWILNREIISSLLGFGLILMLIFIIMNIAAKRCEEKLVEQPEPEIIVDRLKKLTRNE